MNTLLLNIVILILLTYMAVIGFKLIVTGLNLAISSSERYERNKLVYGKTLWSRVKSWWSGTGMSFEIDYQACQGIKKIAPNNHLKTKKVTRAFDVAGMH